MKATLGIAAITLVAGSAALAQSGGNDSANWQAVAACAAKASAAERHGCIDQVLRAAGLLDPVREAQQQRADFGRTQRSDPPAPVETVRPAPQPAPPPVAPAAAPVAQAQAPAPAPGQAAAPAPRPAPPAKVNQITTTIAAARIGGNGKLLVATAEATVWRQLDGETFRIAPSPGTPFEVERGALGSFVCKVGRGNSFRCSRVD